MPDNSSTHDLSTRDIPQAWLDAERDSPTTTSDSRSGVDFNAMVQRQNNRTGSLFLGGLLAVVAAGPLWYFAEATDLADTPWNAAVAGVVIGLIIRLTAAGVHSGSRLMAGLSIFIVVAVAVATISAIVDVGAIYGAAPTVANYEFHLGTRFRDVNRLIAHAGGLVAATLIARSS